MSNAMPETILPTRVGEVRILGVNGVLIYATTDRVDASGRHGETPLTVRGIEYRASVHFEISRPTVSTKQGYAYVHRVNRASTGRLHVSEAARASVIAAIRDALAAFILTDSGDMFLARATLYDAADAVERTKKVRDAAKRALDDADREWQSAAAVLRALNPEHEILDAF